MDGGEHSDYVIIRNDGAIFSALTSCEAILYAENHGWQVQEGHLHSLNFDRVWELLSGRKGLKNSAASEWKLILDAWNMLEDLARTLGISPAPYAFMKRFNLQRIYEEVFVYADVLGDAGSNTGRGLSRKDRVTVKAYLRGICKLIQLRSRGEE